MATASLTTKLGIRKITARIGAEITGVDPSFELVSVRILAIDSENQRFSLAAA